MKLSETRKAEDLKRVADEFNGLPAYEQYINDENTAKQLKDCLETCYHRAKRGDYSVKISTTFRYDDPAKEYFKRYFTELGYSVKIEDSRSTREHPNDFDKVPYRVYYVTISWK